MPKIFISYRREDSKHAVGRLHAALKRHMRNPKRDIFIDIDNIPRGVDFVDHLDGQVAQCEVMLAVIGPTWASVRDPATHGRRLDDPVDFVRIEIASALKRGIPVVPVVLDATPLPRVEELPEDLKPLARRNGERLEHESFDSDVERLIRNLPGKPKPAPRPAPVVEAARKPRAAASKGNSAAWIATVIALGLLVIGGGAWWAITNGGGAPSSLAAGGVGGGEAAGRGSLDVETPLVAPAANSPAVETSPSGSLRDQPPPATPAEDGAAKPPALTALDDAYSVKAGAAFSFNPESNDGPASQKPLKIVEINGKPVSVGQMVTLTGGHKVRLNASSLQFTAGSAAGEVNFHYSVIGKDGGKAQAQVSVRVTPADPLPAPVVATPPPAVLALLANATFREPELVSIPAGSFMMGSPESEAGHDETESPQRLVTVPAFSVGKYEVTVGEYFACMSAGACSDPDWLEKGSTGNISTGTDDHYKKIGASLTTKNFPMVGVSWDDAKKYVAWLNAKVGGNRYRLLTEAEWEYAARAGSSARWSFGDNEESLASYAWYSANSNGGPRAVGTKPANAFGLYDMHGNVWEWVEDCYADNYSAGQPTNGQPQLRRCYPARVYRGGSWDVPAVAVRSAYRRAETPGLRNYRLGFRVARSN